MNSQVPGTPHGAAIWQTGRGRTWSQVKELVGASPSCARACGTNVPSRKQSREH